MNLYGSMFSGVGIDLLKVENIDSARKYPTMHSMPPNSRVPLFKGDEDIFYIVSTDASNTISVKQYAFHEVPILTQEQINDKKYVTFDQFAAFQNELKEELKHVEQSIQQSSYRKQNSYNNRRNNGKSYRSASANQEFIIDAEEQQESSGNASNYGYAEPASQ